MDIKRPTSKQPIPDHAKRVFKGILFDVYQWQQEMYDGTKATFEKIKRTDTVGVIPITKDGKIILATQEQPGADPFIGTLGGRIDKGEDPVKAAKRELREEAGIETDDLKLWYAEQFFGKTDWAIYMFLAYNCKPQLEQELDSGEKIKLKYYSYDEFLDLVAQDNFRDWDITLKVLKALRNPQESDKLYKLFHPEHKD
jgi:ADP-ribose pyrophosphatase